MDSSSSELQAALDRLTKLHPKLIDLGLERTIALSEKCGSPHLQLPPVIHIAGTNGKGSVSAFLPASIGRPDYAPIPIPRPIYVALMSVFALPAS